MPENASRQIAAPSLVPEAAEHPGLEGTLYYLSWPGWELFLDRERAAEPGPEGGLQNFRPLLLPDKKSPQEDLAEILDLLGQLEIKGAEAWTSWLADDRESLGAITRSLKTGAPPPSPKTPLLDDRLFLALWSIMRRQKRKAEALLAEAARKSRQMWAALKGDAVEDLPEELPPASPADDPLYARAVEVWRKLASPLLEKGDKIIMSF